MLKRLRRTFILISMLVIITTISIFYIILTFSNYRKISEQADILTNIIGNNNGELPEYNNDNYTSRERDFITPESRFSTRYFVIYLDENNNISYINKSHISSISEDRINDIVNSLLKSKKDIGDYDCFRYRIKNTENGGKTFILLDIKQNLLYLRNSTNNGILIIIAGSIIVYILIWIFSSRALKPMEENLENQREFITNAGHDLKTPIAIILANTEVLEMSIPDGENNEWLQSIKRQAKKMDRLTKSLLSMSKIEKGTRVAQKSTFDITSVLSEELQDLKMLAKEKNVKINFDNKNKVLIYADKELTIQLIVILIDNAIKYVDENGTIDILINRKNKKQVKIQVINDYKNYKNFDGQKVFERFYRENKSRNNEKISGYGIGLSMAKSIIDSNGGEIRGYVNKNNRVCFEVTLEAGENKEETSKETLKNKKQIVHFR